MLNFSFSTISSVYNQRQSMFIADVIDPFNWTVVIQIQLQRQFFFQVSIRHNSV